MSESKNSTGLFPGFDHHSFAVEEGVQIAATIGGSGPPLLVIPGGGLNAMIPYVTVNGPFNVFEEFKSEYRSSDRYKSSVTSV